MWHFCDNCWTWFYDGETDDKSVAGEASIDMVLWLIIFTVLISEETNGESVDEAREFTDVYEFFEFETLRKENDDLQEHEYHQFNHQKDFDYERSDAQEPRQYENIYQNYFYPEYYYDDINLDNHLDSDDYNYPDQHPVYEESQYYDWENWDSQRISWIWLTKTDVVGMFLKDKINSCCRNVRVSLIFSVWCDMLVTGQQCVMMINLS